jgi:hypothetical protein
VGVDRRLDVYGPGDSAEMSADEAKAHLLANLEAARAARVGDPDRLTREKARRQEIEARKQLRAASNPPDANEYHGAVCRFRDAVRATIIAEDEET